MIRDHRKDRVTLLFMQKRELALAPDVEKNRRERYLYHLDMMEPVVRRLEVCRPGGLPALIEASSDTIMNVGSILASLALTMNHGDKEEAIAFVQNVLMPQIQGAVERRIEGGASDPFGETHEI
jgi:hypothetical protein